MKKVTVLYMEGCPYCRNAARAMDELEKAYSAYAEVPVEWIEETREREKAQPFAGAYYYVPSIFVDGTKVYEAKPGESYEECKRHVETAVRAAVELTLRARRDFLRAAQFLWNTWFAAAWSIVLQAAFRKDFASSAFPASTASRTWREAVRTRDFSAAFLARRFSSLRTLRIDALMFGKWFTSLEGNHTVVY